MADSFTPQEAQQFRQEQLGAAADRRERRALWRQAMDAQKLAQVSLDTTTVTSAYENDPLPGQVAAGVDAASSLVSKLLPGVELDKDYLGQIGTQAATARRSEFTREAEAAYQQHRENIPLEWFMQWDPSDLRMFAGMPEMADYLEEVQFGIAQEEKFQAQVEAETDRRWEARQNRGLFGWARDSLANLVGSGMTGRGPGGTDNADRREYNAIRDEVEQEMLHPLDQHEERIQKYMTEAADFYDRRQEEELVSDFGAEPADVSQMQRDNYLKNVEASVRQQILAGGDAGDILGDKSILQRGIDGTLGVIPWTIDKIDQGLEGTLWAIEALTPGHGTYDALRAEHEQAQLKIKEAMDTMSGRPNEDLIREIRYRPMREVWDTMPETNPEAHQTYMLMAGMNPTMAFGFFQADMAEDPDASQQMADLVEELSAQERQAIEDFEAADFRVSGKLLDMLASYGRNVPGRLSTYAALFFTDGDYFDDAIHGRWGEFFSEIEKESEYFGHTPSAALGIDGSLSGLFLDLGAGIAFDPFTWIFGPRASVRSAKAGSYAEAQAIARSPITQQFTREAARYARSSSKGVSELLHIANWGGSKYIGELMDIVGYRTKQLPASPWRATRGAENAMEVETKFLSTLIDDTVRSSVDDTLIQNLADDILANGYKEYTSITVTRGDGMLFMDDGAKRVLAAERADISHAPVRLNIVDDFAGRPPATTQAADDAVTQNLVNFGGRVKTTTEALDNSIVLNDGRTLTFRELTAFGDDAKNGVFAYIDDAPVGGYYDDAIGVRPDLGGKATKKVLTDDGRTVAQAVMDQADALGFNPLQKISQSDSISGAGLSFMEKEAKRLGQRLDWDSPVGQSLDSFMSGKQTKRSLKGAGAGDVVTRPDQFFPKDVLLGQLDEAALEAATRRAILRGHVPDGAHRGAISRSWNKAIRNAARTNKGTQWVERYLTPQNTVRRFETSGSRALDRIYDASFRIWGDDVVKVDQWTTRFMEFQRKSQSAQRQAMERLKALTPMRHQLDELLDQINGTPYTGAKGQQGAQARAAQRSLQKEYDAMLRKFEAEYLSIDKVLGSQADGAEMARIVEEMWDDYNRTYIATNPAWAGKVDDTGLVPWDDIKKGSLFKKSSDISEGPRNFLSEEMKQIARDLNIDGEELVARLSNTLDSSVAVNVPVSPLELTLAREMGGAAYTRMSQQIAAATLRDAAHGLNNVWKIDKVFRPATAITVSFDELQRIWHIGGTRAVLRWQQDRALFMRARATNLLQGKNPLSRQAVRQGATKLSAKSQRRVQDLSNYPTYLKAAERQLFDGNGLGYFDIKPSSGQYLEAAQRWTGGMLQDSGFRAFLRGPEAFKEWFFSADGARMRNGVALSKDKSGYMGSKLMDGADEAFQGWTTLFEDIILKTAKTNGKYDEVLEAFRDTARRIDDAGGRPQELPSLVFDNLGPIRGIKKDVGIKHPVSALTETFFDTFFMDPVNYRRGFLAEQVRAAETARLTRLFTSQNKTIVADMELERLLGLKNLGGGTGSGLKDMIYDIAFDTTDYVPQGYIDDIVEGAVERELDNVLFTWDRGTRLGSQAQAVFPFGRPWADMAGFWGREMMRKPVLRGQINQTNFLGLRTLYDNVPMPFNPKPAAMMSRLAHTDFTIDKGLHPALPGQLGEGGILPGADESDFSPLFFLPTGGDNPFGALIPGMGYIPMAFLDKLISDKYDPIDNPEEYQNLVDQVADFIPAVGYQAGTGTIPRLLGGGTVGTLTSLMVDGATFVNGEPYFFATSMLGDISRELDRTRELSALLADPEEFKQLLAAVNPADVETLLMALADQADRNVVTSHAAETISRAIVPAKNQYDTALHEIFDVWVEASSLPGLEVRPDLAGADLEDPEIRRQYANDVRKAFFELEGWQQDLYITQQPSLAVNLVGSWDWTPSAVDAGIEGSDLVYRSTGTAEGLAKHQAYVNAGYIRPILPLERAKRIVGTMQASKERAAKHIYESTATHYNNYLFENGVSDETKAKLDWVLSTPFAKEWAIVDARDLWNNWGSMEERLEEALAEAYGIEMVRGESTKKEDQTEWDRLRSQVSIPDSEKPWGSSWPGLDDEELSQRFRGLTINEFTPEVEAIAAGLGIDLTPGMTGLQLFSEVQEVITEVDTPLFSTVRPAYDHYIGDKGVGARAAEAELGKAKHNPDLDEDWRSSLANWQVRADRLGDQWRDEVGGVPLAAAREIAQEFGNLKMTSDLNIDWDAIWEHKYARTFGPLEWEAPQPLSPFEEGDDKRGGVTTPYIKYVPDGDTIVFQERRGAQELRTVRLLGVNARDFGLDDEGAATDKTRLQDFLQKAVDEGATIYLVRDPLFGDTDHYGRQLAWLWIGDEPFYFEDELRSTVTPSETDR